MLLFHNRAFPRIPQQARHAAREREGNRVGNAVGGPQGSADILNTRFGLIDLAARTAGLSGVSGEYAPSAHSRLTGIEHEARADLKIQPANNAPRRGSPQESVP